MPRVNWGHRNSNSLNSNSATDGGQLEATNTSTNTNTSMSTMSLERKLELLESRFTQPHLGSMDPPQQPLTLASTTNHHAGAGSDAGSHSSNSEHSFSFSPSATTSSPGQGHSSLPSSAVRSKRRPSLNTSLHAVERATARHLRKVLRANSPVSSMPNTPTSNNLSHLSATNHSNNMSLLDASNAAPGGASAASNSSSQQTLLTSHLQRHRVVAESPPVPVTPGHATSPKTRSKVITTPVVPSKPSAARIILPSTNTNTPTKTTHTSATTTTTRNRLTRGENTSSKSDHSSNSAANATTASAMKRKSLPKRKHASIKDKSHSGGTTPSASSTTVTTTHTQTGSMASPEPTNKRPKANDEDIRSPTPLPSAWAETSRDRSNSSRTNTQSTSNSSRKATGPTNNRRIHDFFTASTSTGAATTKRKDSNASVPNTNSTSTNINNNINNNNNTTNTNNDETLENALREGTPTSADATIDWQAKCAQLQQLVKDKEEQLKAVTNNKTILHTALQAALEKTRQEMDALKKSAKDKLSETNKVLEDLLRWKSSQQAKELRDTLAANGARLGRIVYARAGMRALESWEEGYATKDLEQRKQTLKEKQKALEARAKLPLEKENASPLEAIEAREAIQMHANNLKREEEELAKEEQALNDEKGAHIRALKRVASEDASRFRSRPKLHNRYLLHCLLGKGGFSEVWRGYDLVELREVAVKIHQLDPRWPDSKKENYTKHVSREYEIHRNVRHPRIVTLYDVFEIDNNSFATVLECCKGTDLDTLLKSQKRIPEKQARALLLQILLGMKYLSQPSGKRQGIIHYDLKPGNILFDEFGDAKITDFGLSKIVDTPDPAESMELTSQGAGTYWYLPPECFITTERVRISNKVDVWSIGVIYYQMLYGARPFGEGKSQDKLLADHTMLNAQQVHFPEHPSVSEAGKSFIRQCLMYDQAFRPTIAQLCENAYVLDHSFSK